VKNPLRLSIAANLALSGLVVWLMREKSAGTPRHAAAPIQATNGPVEIHPIQTTVEPVVISKPFRWSELESTDYRTYLANLRNIGCPEQTIRDILTADIDSVFAQKRAQVENTSSGGLAETQLRQLRGQEVSFLAALLGDAPQFAAPAPQKPPWLLARREVQPAPPLVFGNLDLPALKLNSDQIAAIGQVREEFRNQLGVQDTNDPAYAQRWNRARRDADDTVRGLLGSKVYLQLQAANQQVVISPK
jgi:hypothetical protein